MLKQRHTLFKRRARDIIAKADLLALTIHKALAAPATGGVWERVCEVLNEYKTVRTLDIPAIRAVNTAKPEAVEAAPAVELGGMEAGAHEEAKP